MRRVLLHAHPPFPTLHRSCSCWFCASSWSVTRDEPSDCGSSSTGNAGGVFPPAPSGSSTHSDRSAHFTKRATQHTLPSIISKHSTQCRVTGGSWRGFHAAGSGRNQSADASLVHSSTPDPQACRSAVVAAQESIHGMHRLQQAAHCHSLRQSRSQQQRQEPPDTACQGHSVPESALGSNQDSLQFLAKHVATSLEAAAASAAAGSRVMVVVDSWVLDVVCRGVGSLLTQPCYSAVARCA